MATATLPHVKIKPQPEFAGILKQQETFADADAQPNDMDINSAFDRLMVQSGVDTSPSLILFMCVLCALTLGGGVFIVKEDFLLTALASIFGFAVPLVTTMIMRAKRQSLILRQMPGMTDELARAAKTGRSLDQCIHLIADDTPSPLGDELRLCSRKLKMNVPLEDAVSELPHRTGLDSLRIFTTALIVHQQTGGDLVRVMERLSRTLRDRTQFLGRLRAATATSRATAILMIAIPPLVVFFFNWRDPQYINNLLSSGWGQAATFTGIALEVIGAIWVLQILKQSRRT